MKPLIRPAAPATFSRREKVRGSGRSLLQRGLRRAGDAERLGQVRAAHAGVVDRGPGIERDRAGERPGDDGRALPSPPHQQQRVNLGRRSGVKIGRRLTRAGDAQRPPGGGPSVP